MLFIDRILSYQHTFDELSSGMSAELKLVGEGAELVQDWDVLGTTHQE
jgi:hypothetical protein